MKKLITAVTGTMLMAVLFTGCGVNSYSCKDYYSVEVTGSNGKGEVHVKTNSDMKKQIISENTPDDATDFEEAAYEILLETMEVHCEPNEELENGDVVDIHVSVDEETLASKGIKFTDTDFTYTVEGLEEPVEIDPFEGLSVTFTGISPKAEAEIEYTGDNEFVKEHVRFINDTYGKYAIGDTITVKASYTDSFAEENNVIITQDEKEYTVSDIDEYLSEETDFSELDDLFYNEVQDILAASENFGVGAETDSRGFFNDAKSSFDQYTVNSYTITPYKAELCYENSSYDPMNTYVIFYKLKFNVEKTKCASGIYYKLSDGRELGFVGESDDIYMCIYLNNIVKKTDGSISYSEDNLHYKGWTTSIFGSFIGADFSEIEEDFASSVTSNEVVYSKELV